MKRLKNKISTNPTLIENEGYELCPQFFHIESYMCVVQSF